MTTIIVQVAARVLMPVMLALSLYLLVRGHQSPGGAFVAAIVAGLSLLFRGYAFGFHHVDRLVRPWTQRLLGAGLVVVVGTGVAGWLWGDAFLAAASLSLHLPVVGALELSTTLLFELGVYLTVSSFVAQLAGKLGQVGT